MSCVSECTVWPPYCTLTYTGHFICALNTFVTIFISPSLLYTQRLFTKAYTDFCKRHIAGFLVGLDTTEKLVQVSSRIIVLPKILQRVFQKRLCTELYHSIIRSTAKMYSMIRQVAVRNPSKKRTPFSRQVVM